MNKLFELLNTTKKHYNKQDVNYIKSLTNDIDEVNYDSKSLNREYWIELDEDTKYLTFSIKYRYLNSDKTYTLVSKLSIKELDLSIYVLSECISIELKKGQS